MPVDTQEFRSSQLETVAANRRRKRFARRPGLPVLLADTSAPPSIRRRDQTYWIAVALADVMAALLVVAVSTAWVPTSGLGWSALSVAVLLPLVNAASGLYTRDARVLNKNTLDEAPAIFSAATTTTVLAFLFQSLVLSEPLGAKVVGLIWIGLTITVPAYRIIARVTVRRWLPPERTLVMGDAWETRRIADKLGHAVGLKNELVGVVPLADAGIPGAGPSGAGFRSFAATVKRLDVHRVLISAGTGAPQLELEAIQAAKALGVKVSVLPRVLEAVGSSASYDYVDGITVLGVPRFGIASGARVVKRTFDIIGSTLIVLVALPAIVAIALAVKLTSPGPIFFRQTRIGRDGEAFSMLKFRSMYDGAHKHQHSLREHNEQEDGLFKMADDPRMTRVGKVLRRTSLDELPQLLNVLRGDMSLVGPRPLVPHEDEQIHGWHRRRLHLTPGMTGPWQVLGSSRIPMDEMVTIDYLYATNWSLWSDIKIILRTIGTVFAFRGR